MVPKSIMKLIIYSNKSRMMKMIMTTCFISLSLFPSRMNGFTPIGNHFRRNLGETKIQPVNHYLHSTTITKSLQRSRGSYHPIVSSPPVVVWMKGEEEEEEERLIPEENPNVDPWTVSPVSGVSYLSVLSGLNELYPPHDLEQRNAISRTDGYWAYINNGIMKPPQHLTYGEFDFYFFAQLLDHISQTYLEQEEDNSSSSTTTTMEDKIFCDIGSGTGRLVLAAAALHPNLQCSRGIELLPGIHNLALENVSKCQKSNNSNYYRTPPPSASSSFSKETNINDSYCILQYIDQCLPSPNIQDAKFIYSSIMGKDTMDDTPNVHNDDNYIVSCKNPDIPFQLESIDEMMDIITEDDWKEILSLESFKEQQNLDISTIASSGDNEESNNKDQYLEEVIDNNNDDDDDDDDNDSSLSSMDSMKNALESMTEEQWRELLGDQYEEFMMGDDEEEEEEEDDHDIDNVIENDTMMEETTILDSDLSNEEEEEDDDDDDDVEEEYVLRYCIPKEKVSLLPPSQQQQLLQIEGELPLAPISLECGSFEDPYVYLADIDVCFIFSSCMGKYMLSKLSQAIGRGCSPGTIIITTDFPLSPLTGTIHQNVDDDDDDDDDDTHDDGGGEYEIKVLEQMDGWCWLTGGPSTAYIHKVVKSLCNKDTPRRQKPNLSLQQTALQIVQSYEAKTLTNTEKFLRNVKNDMSFHGINPKELN